MKNSELAKSLKDTIDLYSDFIQTGFVRETFDEDVFDYSYFDNIEPPKDEKKSQLVSDLNEIGSNNDNNTPSVLNRNVSNGVLKKREMIKLSAEISSCAKCNINLPGQKAVSGLGNTDAKIFVLSDFPSLSDIKNNFPLSGDEGEYFKKWIASIGVNYNELFITTLVKCSPENKNIQQDGVKKIVDICRGYLDRQLNIIKPHLILVLGGWNLSSLLNSSLSIKDNHGKLFNYNNIPLIATLTPREVLKNQDLKKLVWADLKILKEIYEARVKNG